MPDRKALYCSDRLVRSFAQRLISEVTVSDGYIQVNVVFHYHCRVQIAGDKKLD